MIVPNKFPDVPSTRKIALIGEAPGKDEVANGRPFCGMSGRFLAALLSRAGVSINSCFLGNVCQHRPENNDFSTLSWNGLEIQHGLEQLTTDLATFQPNIVVLLGNIALKAAKDCYNPHPLKPNSFRFKNSNWRGSLFLGNDGPFNGMKCIATLHPAYCLRDYEGTPLLQFDLRKAVRESCSPKLILPSRVFLTNPTCEQVLSELARIRRERRPTALDIEGGIGTMSCVSFCNDPSYAFIVPLTKKDGSSYFENPYEEQQIWRALTETLEDGKVPKVLQNSLYDRFVLHYSYGIRVRGVTDDTMLRHWELYSELEKSLGVQASIYTDEPYYKGDRKSDSDETFYAYCCRDSAVTLEINQKLSGFLTTRSSNEHYRMNISMLNPMLYMELRGMRYDVAGARSRRLVIQQQMWELQARLNATLGEGFTWESHAEILAKAVALHGKKKFAPTSIDELKSCCYKASLPDVHRIAELLHDPTPSLATIGELESLCGVCTNYESNKQKQALFYEKLQLPVQFTNTRGEEPRPTCDYEAMLKLSREAQRTPGDPRLPIIHMAIDLASLSTRQQMLGIGADEDGRIRCGYNIVGSNTGRVTCYESPTGSGYNLQTIPNYVNKKDAPGGILGDRDLFLADEGYWFFQCDLAGADGWTVAAYSAMLGDSTLLNDYRYGLKPANVLTLILRGKANEHTDRETFKALKKEVSKDDWDYFACKRVQHGCSYLEGALTVSRNILKDSEGKLYMTVPECEQLKRAFFTRYPGILKWHQWLERRLKERPVLTAASGQVRQFFGRPEEILTKAVAFEPQANTTYATNLAMLKLWQDTENRIFGTGVRGVRYDGTMSLHLRIEPLHQVHDALCGQFKKTDTAWAISKINGWFNNTLTIAGQKIVIPFEGGYGPSWGSLNEGKI